MRRLDDHKINSQTTRISFWNSSRILVKILSIQPVRWPWYSSRIVIRILVANISGQQVRRLWNSAIRIPVSEIRNQMTTKLLWNISRISIRTSQMAIKFFKIIWSQNSYGISTQAWSFRPMSRQFRISSFGIGCWILWARYQCFHIFFQA